MLEVGVKAVVPFRPEFIFGDKGLLPQHASGSSHLRTEEEILKHF